MRFANSTAALAAILGATAALAGAPIAYIDNGAALFTVEAPDDWLVRTGFETAPEAMPEGETPAPRILTFEPERPEGVMWVGFWSPPALGRIDDAAEFIATLAPDLLEDAAIEDVRSDVIGGVAARIYSGGGLRDGLAFRFDLAMLQVAPQRVAVGAFIGVPEAREAHGAALAAMLASVRPGWEGAP